MALFADPDRLRSLAACGELAFGCEASSHRILHAFHCGSGYLGAGRLR